MLLPPASSAREPSSAKSSEPSPKQILNVYAPESSPAKSPTKTAAHAHIAIGVVRSGHVVNPFSLGVFQQFVGIDYFLELFFGPGVLLVDVGVVLSGPLIESLLDIALGCRSRNS